MKQFKLIIIITILAGMFSFNDHDTEKERIIKTYFSGWVKKDWSIISNLLAPEFTFTSPNNDDHISTEKFKAKCWVQADYVKKLDFIKFMENGNEAFVTYQCTTKTNIVFRNTEYFNFDHGKIKSIEVFFGTGRGFPTNEK